MKHDVRAGTRSKFPADDGALALNHRYDSSRAKIANPQGRLYLGRGTSYPLALEGALKLKEISYIHAEGYAAGRTQARADRADRREHPVVVIAPGDRVFEKTMSNMHEVAAATAT